MFAWKEETLDEYWELTLKALDWGNDEGPDQIVDDGGDMTMMLLQGAEWEEKYEATGELPDPSRVESDDEKAFYALLKREIPNHPGRFRRWYALILISGHKKLLEFQRKPLPES